MKFIKEFIWELGNAVRGKILLNPLWFLGITCVFVMVLYMEFLSGNIDFTIEEIFAWGIFYIIFLGAGLRGKATEEKKLDGEETEKTEIKQNNISLISFFKNTKK